MKNNKETLDEIKKLLEQIYGNIETEEQLYDVYVQYIFDIIDSTNDNCILRHNGIKPIAYDFRMINNNASEVNIRDMSKFELLNCLSFNETFLKYFYKTFIEPVYLAYEYDYNKLIQLINDGKLTDVYNNVMKSFCELDTIKEIVNKYSKDISNKDIDLAFQKLLKKATVSNSDSIIYSFVNDNDKLTPFSLITYINNNSIKNVDNFKDNFESNNNKGIKLKDSIKNDKLINSNYVNSNNNDISLKNNLKDNNVDNSNNSTVRVRLNTGKSIDIKEFDDVNMKQILDIINKHYDEFIDELNKNSLSYDYSSKDTELLGYDTCNPNSKHNFNDDLDTYYCNLFLFILADVIMTEFITIIIDMCKNDVHSPFIKSCLKYDGKHFYYTYVLSPSSNIKIIEPNYKPNDSSDEDDNKKGGKAIKIHAENDTNKIIENDIKHNNDGFNNLQVIDTSFKYTWSSKKLTILLIIFLFILIISIIIEIVIIINRKNNKDKFTLISSFKDL